MAKTVDFLAHKDEREAFKLAQHIWPHVGHYIHQHKTHYQNVIAALMCCLITFITRVSETKGRDQALLMYDSVMEALAEHRVELEGGK